MGDCSYACSNGISSQKNSCTYVAMKENVMLHVLFFIGCSELAGGQR